MQSRTRVPNWWKGVKNKLSNLSESLRATVDDEEFRVFLLVVTAPSARLRKASILMHSHHLSCWGWKNSRWQWSRKKTEVFLSLQMAIWQESVSGGLTNCYYWQLLNVDRILPEIFQVLFALGLAIPVEAQGIDRLGLMRMQFLLSSMNITGTFCVSGSLASSESELNSLMSIKAAIHLIIYPVCTWSWGSLTDAISEAAW